MKMFGLVLFVSTLVFSGEVFAGQDCCCTVKKQKCCKVRKACCTSTVCECEKTVCECQKVAICQPIVIPVCKSLCEPLCKPVRIRCRVRRPFCCEPAQQVVPQPVPEVAGPTPI